VTTARLNKLTELFDGGKLVTDVGTVLSLEDARLAHEMLAEPRHPAAISASTRPLGSLTTNCSLEERTAKILSLTQRAVEPRPLFRATATVTPGRDVSVATSCA
jgi:hypothetical protein